MNKKELIDTIIEKYKKQCGSLYFSEPGMKEILQNTLPEDNEGDVVEINKLIKKLK